MANFSEFKANDPQYEVRQIITENFRIATKIPEDKTTESPLYSLVGVETANDQQLRHAIDGVDYLSPNTGLSKDSTEEQNVKGGLKTKKLTVSNEGALIADHLYVHNQDENGEPSMKVENDKSTTLFGTLETKGATTLKDKLTVEKGITASNTETPNELGNSNFSTIKVTDTATATTVKATEITSTNITTNTFSATGNASVSGNTTLNGSVTMNNRVIVPSPGAINVNYVRPLRAFNRAPSNGEVPYGTLWGQY